MLIASETYKLREICFFYSFPGGMGILPYALIVSISCSYFLNSPYFYRQTGHHDGNSNTVSPGSLCGCASRLDDILLRNTDNLPGFGIYFHFFREISISSDILLHLCPTQISDIQGHAYFFVMSFNQGPLASCRQKSIFSMSQISILQFTGTWAPFLC